MNRRRIFFCKRQLLGFVKILKLCLLGLLPGCIAAVSIDRNAMGDGVESRAQETGILELANVAQHLDPRLLKHVEPTVLIAGQTARIVEQRAFRGSNQVLECTHFASLATERNLLVGCAVFLIALID